MRPERSVYLLHVAMESWSLEDANTNRISPVDVLDFLQRSNNHYSSTACHLLSPADVPAPPSQPGVTVGGRQPQAIYVNRGAWLGFCGALLIKDTAGPWGIALQPLNTLPGSSAQHYPPVCMTDPFNFSSVNRIYEALSSFKSSLIESSDAIKLMTPPEPHP